MILLAVGDGACNADSAALECRGHENEVAIGATVVPLPVPVPLMNVGTGNRRDSMVGFRAFVAVLL